MSEIFTIFGTAARVKGVKMQGEAQQRGLLAQIPAVDFGLQSFLQQLAGAQQQQAATVAAANYNAKTAMEDAVIAREQAQAEAKQITRSNLLRLGSLRAAAGASGVTASGSVIDVVGDLVTQGELAYQNALYIGELKARGFESDAHLESLRAQSAYSAASLIQAQAGTARAAAEYEKEQLRIRAKEVGKATKLGVTTTILGGAEKVFSSFENRV